MPKLSNAVLMLIICFFTIHGIKTNTANAQSEHPTMDELNARFKANWNLPAYSVANSAANEAYLNNTEKQIFYYLNLARLNPSLFADTYVTAYMGPQGYGNMPGFDNNKASLISELKQLQPLPLLLPSTEMYNYAQCQAAGIVKNNIRGDVHNRSLTGCPKPTNYGEAIFPNAKFNALDLVVGFLIDAGVPSLGHRRICLDPAYTKLGTHVAGEGTPNQCAVLDFTINTNTANTQSENPATQTNTVSAQSEHPTMDELNLRFKANWDLSAYSAANSAANEAYLNNTEKQIFYYLNLARLNPSLFADTYVTAYMGPQGYSNMPGFDQNKVSLIKQLKNLQPLPLLLPSTEMYKYAQCQAAAIVKNNIRGDVHNRSLTGCPKPTNYGEAIYPNAKFNALDLVVGFLIDAGVPSLGHRRICLDPAYTQLGTHVAGEGASNQCAVLDFTSK